MCIILHIVRPVMWMVNINLNVSVFDFKDILPVSFNKIRCCFCASYGTTTFDAWRKLLVLKQNQLGLLDIEARLKFYGWALLWVRVRKVPAPPVILGSSVLKSAPEDQSPLRVYRWVLSNALLSCHLNFSSFNSLGVHQILTFPIKCWLENRYVQWIMEIMQYLIYQLDAFYRLTLNWEQWSTGSMQNKTFETFRCAAIADAKIPEGGFMLSLHFMIFNLCVHLCFLLE